VKRILGTAEDYRRLYPDGQSSPAVGPKAAPVKPRVAPATKAPAKKAPAKKAPAKKAAAKKAPPKKGS
jgi:RNA polymerase primary sigma factor